LIQDSELVAEPLKANEDRPVLPSNQVKKKKLIAKLPNKPRAGKLLKSPEKNYM
jgi:hypothetical protein